MCKTFLEVLEKIKGQADVLNDLDERAVELGVIIPVLRQLEWDTDDMSEIYPQKRLLGAGKGDGDGKVDYALQARGKCRVLMEVKRWSIALSGEHEEQLANYCCRQEPGPNLAVLTNGQHWKFFLPPLSRGNTRQHPEVRKFLDIDIFASPEFVENNFNRFLARSNLTEHTVSETQEEARALLQYPSLASFAFIEPGARTTKSAYNWHDVIQGFCDIMATRHPERCRERILSFGQWFSASQNRSFPLYLEDLDLYVKRVSDSEGRQVISDVMREFGYLNCTFTVSTSKQPKSPRLH